jgi:DNA (cytosine-5)-methyltransferase 1
MHDDHAESRPPRIESLFSGYGGLDLAVEHATGGQTVWFSEINDPVVRVFSHHWPGVPNLGDISTIDWATVPPVDVLIGGFPCQDVSTVGKGAGLKPGTRSGLWSHMATAIDALQPGLVVIENVRGLLSAPAIRPEPEGATPDERNPDPATSSRATPVRNLEPDPWLLGDEPARPLRALGAVLGDLADLRYERADGSAYPHHWPAHPITASGSSSPPTAKTLFRTPLASDSSRGGETLDRVRARRGTIALSHQSHRPGLERTGWITDQQARLGDAVRPDREHLHRWGRYADAIARWEHITGRDRPELPRS